MTTPVLNGQLIGQAQIATGALLQRILARVGISFEEWVALNVTVLAGGRTGADDLVARLVGGLRVAPEAASAAVNALVATGLATRAEQAEAEDEDAELVVTAAGRARHEEISAANAAQAARLYGGISADDLAVAGRVLALVTARARDEIQAD